MLNFNLRKWQSLVCPKILVVMQVAPEVLVVTVIAQIKFSKDVDNVAIAAMSWWRHFLNKLIFKNIKKFLSLKSVLADEKLNKFLEEVKVEFDNFFDFKSAEPLLFFLNSREDLNLIWGRETERWFVGAFKNNSIYILNPEVYEKESSHKKEEFWQTLKHEYCHFYYTQITKSHFPIWLNEGLASFLSGKKLFLKDGYKDKLLNVFDYFDRVEKDTYTVGQFWVEFLIKKFGKDKFLELIKGYPSDFNFEQFAEKFYNVYKFQFDKNSLEKYLD